MGISSSIKIWVVDTSHLGEDGTHADEKEEEGERGDIWEIGERGDRGEWGERAGTDGGRDEGREGREGKEGKEEDGVGATVWVVKGATQASSVNVKVLPIPDIPALSIYLCLVNNFMK